MKKIAILSALALCMGFTSCDENEVIAIPENPESPIFNVETLAVTPSETAAATVDLMSYYNEGVAVPVCNVTVTDFPEAYELSFVMQISKDESFSRPVDLATNYADGVISVKAKDLQDAYVANISKGPKEKTIYTRYVPYAVKGQTTVRLGDPNLMYGPFALSVLPFPSDLVIEEAYYLVGTANEWTVSEGIKLTNSGANQYDDPVFSAKFDVTEGWWWKIVPESTYKTGDWVNAPNASFGVAENGDESLSGVLAARTDSFDPGAGCLNVTGPYLLKINMEEMTYEFSLAIECLYTPGNSNKWSHDASSKLYTTDYVNYSGVAVLDGEFKFSAQPSWDGINYGKAEDEGMLSIDPGAGNLMAGAKGLYWTTANISSLTYTIAGPIATLGVIGDATPGGWDASTNLTPSEDLLTWTGKVAFKGSGEFKLRANDAWDINFGGAVDNLVFNAGNMPTPGEGEYNVTVDFTKFPYTITLAK